MKKLILLLTIMSLTFASCEKDELEPTPEPTVDVNKKVLTATLKWRNGESLKSGLKSAFAEATGTNPDSLDVALFATDGDFIINRERVESELIENPVYIALEDTIGEFETLKKNCAFQILGKIDDDTTHYSYIEADLREVTDSTYELVVTSEQIIDTRSLFIGNFSSISNGTFNFSYQLRRIDYDDLTRRAGDFSMETFEHDGTMKSVDVTVSGGTVKVNGQTASDPSNVIITEHFGYAAPYIEMTYDVSGVSGKVRRNWLEIEKSHVVTFSVSGSRLVTSDAASASSGSAGNLSSGIIYKNDEKLDFTEKESGRTDTTVTLTGISLLSDNGALSAWMMIDKDYSKAAAFNASINFGDIFFSMSPNTSSIICGASADVAPLDPGVPHHFLITWEKDITRLYIDGIIVSEETAFVYQQNLNSIKVTFQSNSHNERIFSVEKIYAWNKTLYDGDVIDIFNGGTPKSF